MKKLRLCIDPGHGDEDLGACYNGIEENFYVWEIAHALPHILRSMNAPVHVELTRWGTNEDPTFTERAQVSDEFNADLFLSLHVNAHTSTALSGGIVFYQGDADCISIASTIAKMQPWPIHRKTNYLFEARDLPDDDSDDWLQRPENVLEKPKAKWKILYEMGYCSYPANASFLNSECGKVQLYATILQGIGQAARLNERT